MLRRHRFGLNLQAIKNIVEKNFQLQAEIFEKREI